MEVDPNLSIMIHIAQSLAKDEDIDPLAGLKDTPVYLWTSKNDASAPEYFVTW